VGGDAQVAVSFYLSGMNLNTFYLLLGAWTFLALILAPVQLRIAAPYGRHVKSSWGPAIDNRLGWMLMEIVSPVALMYWMWRGSPAVTPALYVLAGLWVLHYVNRSVIFPLRLRTRGKRIPVAIVLSAAVFNLFNGFFNGYWWGYLAGPYPGDWLRDPRFILGAVLFVGGAFVNHRSDALLIALRRPGETGYRIPQGWLFRWVSCPNHLGEIVQWFGFALMAWNLPALSFAVWTAANLIPRAVAHHRWYQAQFADYPAKRRAVVPGVW
jgi:3-oxo-5-alpha-steroid 4-dehydrogenase 1